ncbi:MAG: hypothetical protein A2X81_06000 [Desulfobacterales bacterium GWB2_56_26]|nr:MAG: hypothetical protein A2X81_06000 [Desulfobacterales bacterium GWB2_56_26]
MARESSDYREGCPFWSTRAMKCQLCLEGLFIPFNDHIEVYCKTLHYRQCLQFSQHSASHPQPTAKRNRRKYERVAASHRVTLVLFLQSGEFASHLPAAYESAACCRTLDLGKGGMRLTTEQPLMKATVIRFSFADSFPKSVQTGQGQIAWCNKQQNQPDYQAGIAFQDDRLIDTMGLYLGLIISIPPSAG